jgi:hypothetical protein
LGVTFGVEFGIGTVFLCGSAQAVSKKARRENERRVFIFIVIS